MGVTRLTFLLALGAHLLAGDPGEVPKPKAEASATVTVTAEASPVAVVKTPNPVRILDKAAIQASGARTLGELLTDLFPGQILVNGGVGTASSLFLGGSRTQDVVVTLDGIRLTDAAGVGGVNGNSLGLAGIDRIEVQLGPCSSRFGSEAMGGAVALFSSGSAPAGVSGDVKLGLGTQGIRLGAVATAYGWAGGWLRAGVQASQEDQATPTDKPFRSTGVFVGAGQALGEDTLLTFSYRNSYTGVPIPYASPDSRTYDAAREDRSRNEQVIAILRTQFTSQWLGELTVGQALQSRQEPNYLGAGFTPYDSRRNQALGRLGYTPASGLDLNASFDAYEEFASTPAYPSGTDHGEGKHLGVDVEAAWEPMAWLRVVGSVRRQWDRQNYVFTVPDPSVRDATSVEDTWKVGANALLGHGFRVYASGGTGFSLPTLYSVMYNATNFATTPLEREQSTFARLGAGWEQGPWSARVEASRTHFTHLVYFDLNNYVYANGSQLRLQGVEGSLTYRTALWGAEGFWRNQEARSLDVPEAQQLSAAAVIRRPFNTLGAKAWRVLGAWRLESRWSWSGPRYENFGGPPPAKLGASKTHFNDLALGATWADTPKLAFTLRGEHLLQPKVTVADWHNRTTDNQNDAYQVFGFPAQPPTLSLELRYRF